MKCSICSEARGWTLTDRKLPKSLRFDSTSRFSTARRQRAFVGSKQASVVCLECLQISATKLSAHFMNLNTFIEELEKPLVPSSSDVDLQEQIGSIQHLILLREKEWLLCQQESEIVSQQYMDSTEARDARISQVREFEFQMQDFRERTITQLKGLGGSSNHSVLVSEHRCSVDCSFIDEGNIVSVEQSDSELLVGGERLSFPPNPESAAWASAAELIVGSRVVLGGKYQYTILPLSPFPRVINGRTIIMLDQSAAEKEFSFFLNALHETLGDAHSSGALDTRFEIIRGLSRLRELLSREIQSKVHPQDTGPIDL